MEEKKLSKADRVANVVGPIVCFLLLNLLLTYLYTIWAYDGSVSIFFHASKEDKNRSIPAGYGIRYSEKEKNWTVIIPYFNEGRYLYVGRSGLLSWSYDPYSTFPDSVKAKSALFEYIREKDEEYKKNKSYESKEEAKTNKDTVTVRKDSYGSPVAQEIYKYPNLSKARNINFNGPSLYNGELLLGYYIWCDGALIESGTTTVSNRKELEKEKARLEKYADKQIGYYLKIMK